MCCAQKSSLVLATHYAGKDEHVRVAWGGIYEPHCYGNSANTFSGVAARHRHI
jgi:hypothetical protein